MEHKDSLPNAEHSDSLSPLPVEERLLLYWNRFKGAILACILAMILGLVSVQGYRLLKEARLKEVQEAFLNASSHDELALFAKTYPDEPLAAVALLEEAQVLRDRGDFEAAARVFHQAALPLKHSPLEGRALLGEAMSLALGNKIENAIPIFESIAKDETLLDVFRAEAAYQRALLALQAGDSKEAGQWAGYAESIPHAGLWGQKVEMIQLVLPSSDGRES